MDYAGDVAVVSPASGRGGFPGSFGWSCRGYSVRAILLVMLHAAAVCSTPAIAGEETGRASAEMGTNLQATKKKSVHTWRKRKDPAAIPEASAPGLSAADAAPLAALQKSVARLDSTFLVKGFDIPYPSFADSIFQDYGGVRSTLAEYGFGIQANNSLISAINTLNVPRSGPGPALEPGKGTSDQQYWGQKPSLMNVSLAYLTYDLGRYGVPDGQFVLSGAVSWASWQHYAPNQVSLNGLSWYQTFFDRQLEVKIGYVANSVEWVGTAVGGNIANPLGSAATVPFELGISGSPAAQPTAWAKWHINEEIYNQFGLLRSLPINGPTGNTLYDNAYFNPTGFDFTVPNGGLLVMNEFGYQTKAAPGGQHAVWIRAGGMYNQSEFSNYRTGGTDTGVLGGYLLADIQLLQTAPNSVFSAYRGFYIGGSAMYAPEENIPFYEYYEARAYWMGLFDSRPQDLIAFVYSYNGISSYLKDAINQYGVYTDIWGNTASNTFLLSYTGHMVPGIYATVGLSYTINPSLTYTKTEGNALNLLFSTFVNF